MTLLVRFATTLQQANNASATLGLSAAVNLTFTPHYAIVPAVPWSYGPSVCLGRKRQASSGGLLLGNDLA